MTEERVSSHRSLSLQDISSGLILSRWTWFPDMMDAVEGRMEDEDRLGLEFRFLHAFWTDGGQEVEESFPTTFLQELHRRFGAPAPASFHVRHRTTRVNYSLQEVSFTGLK